MCNFRGDFSPKIPKRAQKRGKAVKRKPRAADNGKEHIEAQFSVSDAKRKEKTKKAEQKTEKSIPEVGACAILFVQKANGADKIIEKRKPDTQQEGIRQGDHLFFDGKCHIQPKRRWNTPPRGAVGSS